MIKPKKPIEISSLNIKKKAICAQNTLKNPIITKPLQEKITNSFKNKLEELKNSRKNLIETEKIQKKFSMKNSMKLCSKCQKAVNLANSNEFIQLSCTHRIHKVFPYLFVI